MPTRSLKRTKRVYRKKGGSANALLNYMTRKPGTPDFEKASKKINTIISKLSKTPPTTLKSYSIPHIDRKFNLSSMPAILDGFEPEADDSAKFLKALSKLKYDELKKFNTNPQVWTEECSDLFMINWKSTPSPKKIPSVSMGGGYFSFLTGKSKKKGSRTKKGKKKKGKKGRTQRR